MAKLPHSLMTVFQLKQAVQGYKNTIAVYEKVIPGDSCPMKVAKAKLTRYRSLLRTAEFTLQRKQDEQRASTPEKTTKARKRLLLGLWETALNQPYNEAVISELYKSTKTFIQNYNS